MHNKKLTAIGIWPGVCHGHSAANIFAFKRFIVKAIIRPARTIALGGPTLDHKPINDTMKNSIVIETFFGERDEIFHGLWRLALVEQNNNIASSRMERGRVSFLSIKHSIQI